ncbi:hypothetical protein KO495_16790 [Colwellia sp. D2M02]|nr:hypothetical protein [Colwellia sp. D2M02]
MNHSAAFKLGLNILEKWGCSESQKQAVIGVSKDTFTQTYTDPVNVELTNDQLERISYLANIHGSLRTMFSNPKNVYGFMSMVNNNPYFNGRSPLSLICSGNFGILYEVYKRIDSMKSEM